MQHEEREEIIEKLVQSLATDLLPESVKKIKKNPYKVYNERTILDIMADYGVQRRTAKEWLVCAQIRLANRKKRNG